MEMKYTTPELIMLKNKSRMNTITSMATIVANENPMVFANVYSWISIIAHMNKATAHTRESVLNTV